MKKMDSLSLYCQSLNSTAGEIGKKKNSYHYSSSCNYTIK